MPRAMTGHQVLLRRLVQRNGAAGCTTRWLAEKAGITPEHVAVALYYANQTDHVDEMRFVNVSDRWYLRPLLEVLAERELEEAA